MEVLDANSAILCNYEVHQLLQEIKKTAASTKKKKSQQKNLATITYETLRFLDGTPSRHQSEQVIRQFMTAIAKFGLTQSEKLQLLNTRPTSAVEIQLIIDESEDRLTDEQVAELLDVIATRLPGHPEDGGDQA